MFTKMTIRILLCSLIGACAFLTSCEQTKPRGPQSENSQVGWNPIRPGDGGGPLARQLPNR